MSLRTQ